MEVQNLAAYGIRFETDEARKNLKKLDKTMRDSGKALKMTRMRVESMQKQFGNLGVSLNASAKSSANLVKSITKLRAPIKTLVLTLGKAYIISKSITNAWNNFSAGAVNLANHVENAGKNLKLFSLKMIATIKVTKSLTSMFKQMGKAISSNLVPGLKSLVAGPLHFLLGSFRAIIGVAGTLVRIVGTVLKGAFLAVTQTLNVFVKVVRESFNLLKSLLSVAGSVGKSILTLLNPFALLTKAIQKIASVSPTLASAFSIFLSGQLVQTIRDTGDAFIFISNRVRLVTKTMTQQALAMDRVYKIAIRTRSSFFAVADLFSRVGLTTEKLGISMRQVAKLTEAVGKSAQISGTAARTYTGALIQLGQAFSIGVLRGDEFRSVQEALPALMQQVANRMGVTRGQLRELAYQGKLTSRVLVDTILKSAGELDKQFAKIKPTIGSAIEVVRTAFTRLVGRINESTGIFNKIAQLILDFGKYLDSIPERKIKMVQDFFVLGLGKLRSVGSSLVSVVGDLSSKVVDLVTNFAKLNKGETKAETVFGAYVQAIVTVLATVKAAVDFIPNLITRLAEIGKAASKMLPLFKAAFIEVFDKLFGPNGSLATRLKGFIKIIGAAIKDMISSLENTFSLNVGGIEIPLDIKMKGKENIDEKIRSIRNKLNKEQSALNFNQYTIKQQYGGKRPKSQSHAGALSPQQSDFDRLTSEIEVSTHAVKKLRSELEELEKQRDKPTFLEKAIAEITGIGTDATSGKAVKNLEKSFGDLIKVSKIAGDDLKKQIENIVKELKIEYGKIGEEIALILYRATEAGSSGANAPRGALGKMKRLRDLKASERRREIAGPYGADIEKARDLLPQAFKFSGSGFSTRTQASAKESKKSISELESELEKLRRTMSGLGMAEYSAMTSPLLSGSQELEDLRNSYVGIREAFNKYINDVKTKISGLQDKKFQGIFPGMRGDIRSTRVDIAEGRGMITSGQAESAKASIERSAERLALEVKISDLTSLQQADILRQFDLQTRLNEQLRTERIERERIEKIRQQAEADGQARLAREVSISQRRQGLAGQITSARGRLSIARTGTAGVGMGGDPVAIAKATKDILRTTKQQSRVDQARAMYGDEIARLTQMLVDLENEEYQKLQEINDAEKERIRLKKSLASIEEATLDIENKLKVLELEEKLLREGKENLEIQRQITQLATQQARAKALAAASTKEERDALRKQFDAQDKLDRQGGIVKGLRDARRPTRGGPRGKLDIPEVANIQKEIGEAVVGFLQDTSLSLQKMFPPGEQPGPGNFAGRVPLSIIQSMQSAKDKARATSVSTSGLAMATASERKSIQNSGVFLSYLTSGFGKIFSFIKEGFSTVFGFLKDTFLKIVPKGAKSKGILDAMGITFTEADKAEMATKFGNSIVAGQAGMPDSQRRKVFNDDGTLTAERQREFEADLESKGLKLGGLNQGGQQLAGQFGGMIAGAGPNAARGMQVAQATAAGGPIAGIAAMVLSNEKIKESLDKFMGLIMDIFDGLISPFVEMFSGFVDMLEPVLKMIAMMLKPFKMIFRYLGNFLRILGVMFVKIMRPLAKIMEALKPAIEFLGEVLMYVAEIINVIASFFGSVISFITGQGTGNEATDEFSLEYEQGILHTFMDTISSIADNMKTIEDAMKAIETSALNLSSPATKLEEQAATYQELLAAAKKEGATSDDIKEFSSFAKTYLQNAKDIFKSSEAYTSLYDQVLSDMKSIGDAVKEDRVYQEAVAKANTYLKALGSTFSIGLEDSIFTVIQKVEERLSFLDEQLSAKQYSEFDFGGTGGDYSVDTSSTGETGFSLGGLWDAIVKKLIEGLSWVGSGLSWLWEELKKMILRGLGYDGKGISIPIIPNPFDWNNPIFKIDLAFDEGGNVPIYAHGGNVASSGGYAVGPSHQSGMLGMTRDGSPFLFEGGEYIINKKSVDKLGIETLEFVNSLGDGGPTPGSNRIPEYGYGGTLYEAFRKDLILSLGNTKPSAGVEEAFNQLTSGSGYVVFGNRSKGQGSMQTSEGDAITGDQGSMIGYSQEFDKSGGIEASIKNPISEMYGYIMNFLGGREEKVFNVTEHTPGGEDVSKMGIRAGARLNLPQWWNTKIGFDIMPPTNKSLDDISFSNVLGMFDSGGYVGTPTIDEYYNSVGGSRDRFTEQAFKAAGMTRQDDYIVTGRPGTLLRAGILDTTYPVIDGGMPIPFTDKEVFLRTNLGVLDVSKSSAEMGTRKRLMPGSGMDPFLFVDFFTQIMAKALPLTGDIINSLLGFFITGSFEEDTFSGVGNYKPGLLELIFGQGGRDYNGERALADKEGREYKTDFEKGNRRGLGMGILWRIIDTVFAGSVNSAAWIMGNLFPGSDFNEKKFEDSKGNKASYNDLYNPVSGEQGIGAMLEGIYKEVISSEAAMYVGGAFNKDGSLAKGADGLGSGEWFFTLAQMLAPYYMDDDAMMEDQRKGIYKDKDAYVRRNRLFGMKELDFVAEMPMQLVDFLGHTLKYMTQGEAATKLGRGGFGEFFFDIFDLIFNVSGKRRTNYENYNSTARSSLEKGGTRRPRGYADGGMIPRMPEAGAGVFLPMLLGAYTGYNFADKYGAKPGGASNQEKILGGIAGGALGFFAPGVLAGLNILDFLGTMALGHMGEYNEGDGFGPRGRRAGRFGRDSTDSVLRLLLSAYLGGSAAGLGYGGMTPTRKMPEAGSGLFIHNVLGAMTGSSLAKDYGGDQNSQNIGALLGLLDPGFAGNAALVSAIYSGYRQMIGDSDVPKVSVESILLGILASMATGQFNPKPAGARYPGKVVDYTSTNEFGRYPAFPPMKSPGRMFYGSGGKLPEAGAGSLIVASALMGALSGLSMSRRSDDISDFEGAVLGGTLGAFGGNDILTSLLFIDTFDRGSRREISLGQAILQFALLAGLGEAKIASDSYAASGPGGVPPYYRFLDSLGLAGLYGMGGMTPGMPKKYAVGGPVYGPSHAQGGVLAELEGGEYVIPKNVRMMQSGGSAAVTGGSGYASRSGSGASQMTGAGGGGSDFARLEQVLLSWLEQFESLLLGPDGFLPGLQEELQTFVRDFLEAVEKLLVPLGQLYVAFAIIAALELGALFVTLGGAIYTFLVGPFAAFVAAYWPVIAVIAAIAAVYLIYQNNVEYFNEKLTDLIETIQAVAVAMLFFVTLPFTISAAIVKAIVEGFTSGFSGVNLGEIFGDLLGSATGIEGFRASFFNYGRWFGMGDKFLIDIPISWEEGDTWKKYFREGGYMSGPSHEAGGIPIEVEGGEWIISKKAVDFWGSDVFKFLNEAKLPQFGNGNEVNWDQKQTMSKLNSFGISGGISTDDFLGGAARDLWNRLVGEKYVEAGIDLAPNPGAYLRQNIFKNGGDTSTALEAASTVTEKFFGFRDRVGSNITGYIEASLGLLTPQMKTESYFDYDPPRIGGGGILGGKVIPGVLGEGGHIDPMVVGLLTELVDAVREGQDTEVNVFTDLRGESRAAVTDFRSEMRERDLRGLRTA